MTETVQTIEKPEACSPATRPDPQSLIAGYIDDQQQLTAVERFSALHESTESPAQAKYYRDLIPLEKPAAGEQYAFDVDLDLCSGCKACVSACHHMNGLEEDETWRFVGQLTGVDALSLPIVQHVTTACHHCIEPGCLTGCPTNAYEKDPVTGVVRHLDDQCFGCQYCTMACPYEVPQYSVSKGIVRKCDMCHDRLAVGEAPACVQACPNQAIQITKVAVADVESRASGGAFLSTKPLAGVPSPSITQPTTIYRTKRPLANESAPVDLEHATVQHAHTPLVVMLVLTQFGVGLLALGVLMRWLSVAGDGSTYTVAVVLSTLITHVGLLAALLHLGRPQLAFRSVLGWRHSWLSREAIVFGLFAPVGVAISAYAVLPWLPYGKNLQTPLEIGAIVSGIAGVYCSAKIYLFTQREFWLGVRTGLKFGLTPVVLGLSALLAIAASCGLLVGAIQLLAFALIGVSLAKLGYEASQFVRNQRTHSLQLTAGLLRRDLRSATAVRFLCGSLGGLLLPMGVLATSGAVAVGLAITGVVCCLVGELVERYLYFSAVVPLKMPGVIPS